MGDSQPTADFDSWWQQVQAVRKQIEDRVGVLPERTPGIAEDRMCDLECIERPDALAWLEETQHVREDIAARVGTYPDPTIDIAEDRQRDN